MITIRGHLKGRPQQNGGSGMANADAIILLVFDGERPKHADRRGRE